jgi:hypothetical protein
LEAQAALRSLKMKQSRGIRYEVPRDESWVSVGGMLALGYGRKRRSRKKREKRELRRRHNDCYWVEVSKRAEKTEQSKRKQDVG